VWALPLAGDSTWRYLGSLPASSYGHVAFYDTGRDRMVAIGGMEVADLPRTGHSLGAVVWSTPVDSVLQWTRLGAAGDAALPGPPNAHAAFDARTGRVFLASDSTLRVRTLDDPGPWAVLGSSTPAPAITNAIAFDPVREQLLALFADLPGAVAVDAWALAVGPMSVSVLAVQRVPDAVTLDLRSITAYGLAANLERREEGVDWQQVGPIAFGIDGDASFTDRGVRVGHDYHYRVSVMGGAAAWHSEEIFVSDPGSVRFALLGARPNPAVGSLQLAFALPAAGPARLEVFDIHGRRRWSQDVGAMGPGTHTVRIVPSATWRAGVFYARLRRGSQSQCSRLILLP
jgi:hypothetical protein